MSDLTLERAKEILRKHVTEPHLFVHAAAVSSAMGALAEHFGGDKDHWSAIGYLHDVDFEKFPDEHCQHVRELLEPEGISEDDITTIISHGYGLTGANINPKPIAKKVCSPSTNSRALFTLTRSCVPKKWRACPSKVSRKNSRTNVLPPNATAKSFSAARTIWDLIWAR